VARSESADAPGPIRVSTARSESAAPDPSLLAQSESAGTIRVSWQEGFRVDCSLNVSSRAPALPRASESSWLVETTSCVPPTSHSSAKKGTRVTRRTRRTGNPGHCQANFGRISHSVVKFALNFKLPRWERPAAEVTAATLTVTQVRGTDS
jgi:hypothetical protein